MIWKSDTFYCFKLPIWWISIQKYWLNWLQIKQECWQRHILRIIATSKKILCFARKGWKECTWWWMEAWRPVSNTSTAQWTDSRAPKVSWLSVFQKGSELKNWMLKGSAFPEEVLLRVWKNFIKRIKMFN